MKKYILSALRHAGYSLSSIAPLSDLSVYRRLYSPESISNHRFLNIGAGDFCHHCWTNVDRNIDWFTRNSNGIGKAVKFDLFGSDPLPAESNTIELIYISHTLGHIDAASVNHVLKESFRVLKPGGRIRIITEDMDLFFNAWQQNDRDFFYWKDWESLNTDFKKFGLKKPMGEASITQLFLEEFAASASEIADEGGPERISDDKFKELFTTLPADQAYDYCVDRCPKELQSKYTFRHMNWFNEAKLTRLLKEAGFDEVYRSAYLQSRAHVLRNGAFFDKTVPSLSLYMEAKKS
jgi:SAM-dependent methyltransferase